MKLHVVIVGGLLLAMGGCSKKAAPAGDPDFDRRWTEISTANPDTFYIEDDRAAGLMGKVTRSPEARPAPSPTGGPLPERLEMRDISRTIRGNLSAVKVCYLRQRRTATRSGKAIVDFDIKTDGSVEKVRVTAPAFKGTNLPRCVGQQVKRMTFPKFQKGPQQVSYPFVFVGS